MSDFIIIVSDRHHKKEFKLLLSYLKSISFINQVLMLDVMYSCGIIGAHEGSGWVIYTNYLNEEDDGDGEEGGKELSGFNGWLWRCQLTWCYVRLRFVCLFETLVKPF